jgi:hypothetical protein
MPVIIEINIPYLKKVRLSKVQICEKLCESEVGYIWVFLGVCGGAVN